MSVPPTGSNPAGYVAALSQKAGRIQVGAQDYEVTFEPGGDETAPAVDAAYEEKYKGSSAVPIMQGTDLATLTIINNVECHLEKQPDARTS